MLGPIQKVRNAMEGVRITGLFNTKNINSTKFWRYSRQIIWLCHLAFNRTALCLRFGINEHMGGFIQCDIIIGKGSTYCDIL